MEMRNQQPHKRFHCAIHARSLFVNAKSDQGSASCWRWLMFQQAPTPSRVPCMMEGKDALLGSTFCRAGQMGHLARESSTNVGPALVVGTEY
jgi:hypothetical protein